MTFFVNWLHKNKIDLIAAYIQLLDREKIDTSRAIILATVTSRSTAQIIGNKVDDKKFICCIILLLVIAGLLMLFPVCSF